MSTPDRYEELGRRNLYDELMALRDRQRAEVSSGIAIVRGSRLPRETNRQGIYQWYMHPLLDDTVIKTEMIAAVTIPPGSRTGQQRFQGGQLLVVLEGAGHSVIDGAEHRWKTHDLLTIPLRPAGVVVQHFNDSDSTSARLLLAEPNLVHTVGVDRGAGFEQLLDCPEYEAPTTTRPA